jgi:hypothetical protein
MGAGRKTYSQRNNVTNADAFHIFSNVRDEVSLLASGTKACSAGDVPEVPQAQGLAPSAR